MSTAKDTAKEIAKCKGNRIDLKIGDRVIHSLTGKRGMIEEVATVGDQTLLSVRVGDKLLTKLNRQEFALATDGVFVVSRDIAKDSISQANAAKWFANEKVEGEISHNSILEELV